MYIKQRGKITNKEYQVLNSVSNKTAYIDLTDLVEKNLFIVEGSGKRGSYILKVMKK
jgi:ATP-dependent DNA helicase RecG